MSDVPSDDRPMTEEEWEKLMRESDARSARYGELLETLMDHPERDAIVEQEMGWDKFEDDGIERPWLEEMNREPTEEEMEEANEEIERSEQALEQMPAYARASEFGLKVHRILQRYFIKDQEDQDEDLMDAHGSSLLIAAKLAGGHGMGYDDEALCGNIVCCRRSQAAAEECLRGLCALRDREFVPGEIAEPLIRECEDVLTLVKDHIAELRSRVWWQ